MNLLDEIKRLRNLSEDDYRDEIANAGDMLCDALEKAIEVVKLVAPFENHLGGFNATYNRTSVEFNYPGKPKASALLKEWGIK